jgi:type 1 glutamine amidotransferase
MTRRTFGWALGFALAAAGAGSADEPKIRVLLLDGQNNHNWKATTPVLKKTLETTGRFDVAVVTAPQGKTLTDFEPKFSDFQVVVSNYNGALWPEPVRQAFVAYVRGGGGFVPVHAANNAFPEWPEYNEIIGLGGWGGRSEKSGPYLRVRDGKIVEVTDAGRGGSHGAQHEFVIVHRQPEHPILAGLPSEWMHGKDELYDRLRGPAKNITVLATAFSDPKTKGSGEHEPLLMTIEYGKGRVFHTALGHDLPALRCVGFQTTFQRGVEWAATGKVTQNAPADFPTASAVSSRP